MSCIVNNGDQDPSILINGFGEGYGDADKDRHIAVTNDRQVICAATQQGYRDGLDWLHKLYAEMCIRDRVMVAPSVLARAAASSVAVREGSAVRLTEPKSVSYTHLDVYKRQMEDRVWKRDPG